MDFKHQAPFITAKGEVITMKALVTMSGVQHVECYEDNGKYNPATITPNE